MSCSLKFPAALADKLANNLSCVPKFASLDMWAGPVCHFNQDVQRDGPSLSSRNQSHTGDPISFLVYQNTRKGLDTLGGRKRLIKHQKYCWRCETFVRHEHNFLYITPLCNEITMSSVSWSSNKISHTKGSCSKKKPKFLIISHPEELRNERHFRRQSST